MEKIIYIGCGGVWTLFNPKLSFWVKESSIADTVAIHFNGGNDCALINFPDKEHMDRALPEIQFSFIDAVTGAIEGDGCVRVIDADRYKELGEKPIDLDGCVYGTLEWSNGPGSDIIFKEAKIPRHAGHLLIHKDYLPKQ